MLLGAVLVDLIDTSLVRWELISEFWRDAMLGMLILLGRRGRHLVAAPVDRHPPTPCGADARQTTDGSPPSDQPQTTNEPRDLDPTDKNSAILGCAGVLSRLNSWEGFLLLILIITIIANTAMSPVFLTVGNQINLFQLSIEKIIIALVMTLIIINGEIDLSVASMMGHGGLSVRLAIRTGPVDCVARHRSWPLAAGAVGGAFNAFWITRVGLPSLVVTLAMLIGFRGVARILVEDRGITDFPDWFDALGQESLIGPLPLSLLDILRYCWRY